MSDILGEGMVLRLPDESDGERWLELFCDPDQLRFGTPSVVRVPRSLEDLDGRVAEARRKYAAGEPTTFTIATAEDPDRFVGTISWSFHVPPPLRVADVGYSVHPDSRGHGIAGRALRAITRWLTDDPDGPQLARVQLDHSTENPASCHVALSAGYEREGVRRAFLPLRDADVPDGVRRHDVCMHGFVP
jgi:RimJ/RimL family protein N-acetyltransferase